MTSTGRSGELWENVGAGGHSTCCSTNLPPSGVKIWNKTLCCVANLLLCQWAGQKALVVSYPKHTKGSEWLCTVYHAVTTGTERRMYGVTAKGLSCKQHYSVRVRVCLLVIWVRFWVGAAVWSHLTIICHWQQMYTQYLYLPTNHIVCVCVTRQCKNTSVHALKARLLRTIQVLWRRHVIISSFHVILIWWLLSSPFWDKKGTREKDVRPQKATLKHLFPLTAVMNLPGVGRGSLPPDS